jgi:hypothetical protein
MRRKALFYVLLGCATFGLSRVLQAWRQWRQVPSVEGGAQVALFALAVLGAMLWLGFLLYEVDRAAGRVRHRVGLYEWVLDRRTEGRRRDPFRLSTGRADSGGRGAG